MPIVLPLFAKAFLTLFVVIDPVGLAPLYLALVSDRTEAEQTQIATRAVLVSAGILLAFGLTGAYVLHNLGISLQSTRSVRPRPRQKKPRPNKMSACFRWRFRSLRGQAAWPAFWCCLGRRAITIWG